MQLDKTLNMGSMEERKCEKMMQKAVKSDCQDVQHEKPSSVSLHSQNMDGRAAVDTKIAAPTPEKANESLRNIYKDETTELPENYKVVAEIFNHMTCSLRLLALRKKLPVFESISRQVEILSGRKFSCKHLSQIKYVLPEAIHTEKILVHDQKTLCMKPDIKITLSFNIIEGHQEQSSYMALHQLFTSRLLDMASKIPMVCEIPGAEMPEPFNQRFNGISKDALPVNHSTGFRNCSPQNGLLSNSTHLSPSFNECFSKRMAEESEYKTPLLTSPIITTSSSHKVSTDLHTKSVTNTACETTPLKVEVDSSDLTLQTPAQLTPQRSVPSCDNKVKNMTNQIVTPYSAKRSLDFCITESEENASHSVSDEIGGLKSLDHLLHQSIVKKGIIEEKYISKADVLLDKGEKSRCSSKNLNTNQNMPAGLNDLIASIHHIFKSINCSAITKDELIYKIMIQNCEIVERKEVEEQIGVLERLIPDWICSKLVHGGDVMYKIKKQVDPSSVCSKLYEEMTAMAELHDENVWI